MNYRRADHVAWRRIDTEMVLVDLVAKEMLGLDADGGEVWDLFDQARDGGGVALAVAGASAGAVDAVQVETFIDELVTLGLLVATSEPTKAVALCDVPQLSAPPRVLWREEVRQAAGTCAFLPGSSPLCNQAPFS